MVKRNENAIVTSRSNERSEVEIVKSSGLVKTAENIKLDMGGSCDDILDLPNILSTPATAGRNVLSKLSIDADESETHTVTTETCTLLPANQDFDVVGSHEKVDIPPIVSSNILGIKINLWTVY